MKAVLYHFADFHHSLEQGPEKAAEAVRASGVVGVRATPHVTTRVLAPLWMDSFADEAALPLERRDVADAVYENVIAFLQQIAQDGVDCSA